MGSHLAQQLTAINKVYYREVREAKQFSYLHFFRNERICQAREHRSRALRALGIRDDRRTGLRGI